MKQIKDGKRTSDAAIMISKAQSMRNFTEANRHSASLGLKAQGSRGEASTGSN
eukprot:CAMPEP_0185619656 /NCGR_PEP_ID=MMETSP0436-20130131/51311_1 /TAXON_ID=626734 ORGANISM="Favella taraikaensis, Strain Fe Narragansett Bay" /NCGR_SAMPLE_ID=MMETSP0436 /ASSEMBLY_ACC=CAM_ASM_000390 /LENGTH=52 /DNA_ID=CAMNT_0028259329 /DNA_START=637 /DNA_END=795 /DNA_ORIENTATION=-